MRRGRIGALIIAVGIFLIIQIPVMNLGLSYADEGFLILNAKQIRQGMVPFRDFFLTTTPGAYYLQAGLNIIFGESLLVERWAHIVLVVTLLVVAWWVYKDEKWPVGWYLVALGLTWVWAGGFGFYNLEAVIVVMVMVGALRRRGWKWAVTAGVAAGMAVVFKQSIGGVMLILGWLVAKGGRKQFLFGAGGVLILMVGYFFSQGAGKEFINYTLFFAKEVKNHQNQFILHRLMLIPVIIIGTSLFRIMTHKIRRVMIAVGFFIAGGYLIANPGKWLQEPFIAYSVAFLVPVLVLAWKWQEADRWPGLEAVFGLGFFLATAISGYDFGTVAISGVLLYPIGLRLVKNRRVGQIMAIFLALFWLDRTILYTNKVYNSYPIQILTYRLNLPVANGIKVTKTEGKELENLVAIIQIYTQPNEPILCFPHCPLINVLSDRPSPSYFSFFYPETFRVTDQNQTIKEIQNQRTKLIIIQKAGYIDPYAESRKARLPEMMKFFKNNYELLFEFDNFEIYKLAGPYFSTLFLAS